jgi:23S rRNA (pseudouridine1915-N3)-methyltransferase
MKIKLIVVGKTSDKYLKEGELKYEQRLKHYIKFQDIIISDIKNAKNLSQLDLKRREGEQILSKIENNDELILLDDKGNQFSSMEFSEFFNKKMISSSRPLVFVVGGAFGFSDEVYKRANLKFSLSKMTFSHQMVRLIFKEQLYRAFTILKGEKYHHV